MRLCAERRIPAICQKPLARGWDPGSQPASAEDLLASFRSCIVLAIITDFPGFVMAHVYWLR